MIVIVWSIIISSSLYGFISLNQKVTQLKERQENYVIKMHAESDYIVSKEAKLLESFTQNKVSNTSSNTSVFDSLQGEPLMIVSTDEHEGVLELTVLGSTERLINWINTVDEKENKIQSNYLYRDIFNLEVEADNWCISKLFINFYKDEVFYKQESQYYRDGSKDVLFFNEQGRVVQKDIFEIKSNELRSLFKYKAEKIILDKERNREEELEAMYKLGVEERYIEILNAIIDEEKLFISKKEENFLIDAINKSKDSQETDFYVFYVNYLSKKEYANQKVLVGYNGIDGKEVTMSKLKEDINKRVDELLEIVGLSDKKENYPEQLSGGQKQRLSIARAVVKRPDIYIFDDSFSALDYKTDRILREALTKETAHMTKLIVAQRISTIMEADLILVLDQGRVVGQGTHKDLLKDNAVYREIAYSQISKEELEDGQ